MGKWQIIFLLPTTEKKTPYETTHKTRYMANRVWYDNYGASLIWQVIQLLNDN